MVFPVVVVVHSHSALRGDTLVTIPVHSRYVTLLPFCCCCSLIYGGVTFIVATVAVSTLAATPLFIITVIPITTVAISMTVR